MNKKTVYYNNFENDFSGTHIKARKIDKTYKYHSKNLFYRFLSFFIYYFLAIPILGTISLFHCGIKVKGRKNLLKLWNKGFFLYGNHAYGFDPATTPCALAPKRGYIIANPDGVSIKGIGWLTKMLGAIPLADDYESYKNMLSCIQNRLDENCAITIFPEAHIWPYCTFLRNFPVAAFHYPVKFDAPVVAMAETFRVRKKWFTHKEVPALTVTFSKPFYPDSTLPRKEAMKKLRNQVYEFLKEHVENPNNVEFVKYVKQENLEETTSGNEKVSTDKTSIKKDEVLKENLSTEKEIAFSKEETVIQEKVENLKEDISMEDMDKEVATSKD